MNCAAQCPKGDSACTITCSLSYPSSSVDSLFQCLYVDHECVTLPPPDAVNNATCRKPSGTVANVDESKLDGLWYVVKGFNPLYDCYDCQMMTYEIKDGKINQNALFSFTAVNKTQIWPTVITEGEANKPQPGHMQMIGKDNGMTETNDWYVMHLDDDTFIVYYCGEVID